MIPRKLNATIEHLINSQVADDHFHFKSSFLDIAPPRMTFGPPCARSPVTYRQIENVIRNETSKNAAYYIDTNFFSGSTKPESLWRSLQDRFVQITPLVWDEMQPWLKNPFRNHFMRYAITDAQIARARWLNLNPASQWTQLRASACNYYIDLLAVRKRRGALLHNEFVEENGRNPTTKEFDKLLQSSCEDHEIRLVRKGKIDSTKPNFLADEQLVATAVCDAIINRREVTILTSDSDILEQFRRLVHLLDVQYQAMLFAEQLTANPERFLTRPLRRITAELMHYFASDLTLVRKPVAPGRAFVEWLLPAKCTSCILTCLLFGGNKNDLHFTPLQYIAEGDMSRLLDIKSLTGGRNTNLLGSQNCHVTGFPVGVPEPRQWVIVAQDNSVNVGPMNYSMMDIAHSNLHKEHRQAKRSHKH